MRLLRRASSSLLLACWIQPCQSFAGIEIPLVSSRTSASSYVPLTSMINSQKVSPSTRRSMGSSLLLLSMTATSRNKERSMRRTTKATRSSSSSSSSGSSSTTSNNYILQDDHRINRQLAEQFHVWEQEMRQRNSLEPLDFSMRSGLRWVHEAALRQIGLRKGSNNNEQDEDDAATIIKDQQSSALYNDLVQDGLSALLQAVSSYDANHEESSWPDYAQRHIQKAVNKSLEQEEHLIQLPPAVRKVVMQARQVYRALRRKQRNDTAPVTLDMVAKRLHMATNELGEYLQWYNRHVKTKSGSVVSLESTVEVSHPMLDDSNPHFVDVDDWEWKQGYHRRLLADGKTTRTSKPKRSANDDDEEEEYDAMDILEYLDDYRETEGDDDAWIQEHEQVAGLLQDVIPDKEEQHESILDPSLEDNVLADVIRENLGSFLQMNLDPQELTIVEMTFGLEGRQPASFRQMAWELNLQDKAQAVQLLERSLDKLRTAFRERYLEPHDDSDDDLGTESV